jgi:MFS family permease
MHSSYVKSKHEMPAINRQHINGATIRGRHVMWAAGAAICVTYILSTLPTPLYPVYEQRFYFSRIILTVIYAVYVIGTITAMFFFGRLSDQVGRRIVVLISLGIAAAAALVFALAQAMWWLFPGRILSGLGIALVSGAATAWIVESEPDEDKAVATQFAIAANFLGLGIGPLMAGIFAQYLPWPLRLPYGVFIVALVPLSIVIWKTEETLCKPRSLGDASVKPRLAVPREIMGTFIPAAVAAFATFAVLGFYTALLPSLLQNGLQNRNHAVAGAVVAELFFAGTIVIALTRRLPSDLGLLIGLCALVPSLGLIVVAGNARSMLILLLGTALSGVATGLGYRCSLQQVNESAPDNQRSEIVSAYLIACYAGISLPVIGVAIMGNATGMATADIIFAVFIGLLAAFAVIVQSWHSRKEVRG